MAVINRDLIVDYQGASFSGEAEYKIVSSDCRRRAKQYIDMGYTLAEVMEDLGACLEQQATAMIQEKNEEIAFESRLRLSISYQLENHTCADETKETSEALEIREWNHDGQTRKSYILHDRPSSQIHVLKSFISQEECQAIQDAAAPKLHRGTVADGKGGHQLSEHRKAWQAGIRVPWEREQNGDLIARVVRRVYDYANHVTGYNLTVEGQEDLMSIQYFGNGKDSDESPDQYRPHWCVHIYYHFLFNAIR